ncbi:MAG: efflux RND transporter periplasmic adaptor subunit [Candidatus Hydrogenedentota bacterium]
MSKLHALCSALAVCCAALLVGCPEEEDADEAQQQDSQPVKVLVAPAEKDTLRETVQGIGTLRALEQVELRPEVGGLVRDIHFEEGARVEADQRLFTIDDAKLQRQRAARKAAIELARVRLGLARKTYERVEMLQERGSAPPEEYDRAHAQLDEARAEINRLEAELALLDEQIGDTIITAPFAGEIGERTVDVGDFVSIGQMLATVYLTDPLEVAFAIPERFIGVVKQGQAVDASLAAYPDKTFEGDVIYVSPSVDEATRSFTVKARIANPAGRLRPGAFAHAAITLEVHEARPVIPEEALVSTRAGYLVYEAKDGTAHRRDVRIGLREAGRVEIREGLDAGVQVISKGHMNLSDGTPIEPVEEETAAGDNAGTAQPEQSAE